MKTREEIQAKIAELKRIHLADEFEEGEYPDWADIGQRITALMWVVGLVDGELTEGDIEWPRDPVDDAERSYGPQAAHFRGSEDR